jgi:ParB family chromosome partitioning protein
MENFPQASKGTTRDHIASRVGLGSGRTYQKAAKVISHSDQEANLGHKEVAQVLLKTLNEQSVDSAHALLKKTPEELTHIANLITNGKAKSIKQAVK